MIVKEIKRFVKRNANPVNVITSIVTMAAIFLWIVL